VAVKRRGRGEDSVYFDQANGYWVASVSLGFSPDGSAGAGPSAGVPRPRSVTSSGISARISPSECGPQLHTPCGRPSTTGSATGSIGRSAATVTKYRHVLKPVLELTAHAPLRELTAHDVRRALTVLGKDRSRATVAIAHNALTRAIRHAEGRDLVRRNVAALVDSPKGQIGRPSQALTVLCVRCHREETRCC